MRSQLPLLEVPCKNYNQTIKLVEEILLEPRWDKKKFDLLKQSG
jgi:hypothetical protein